jgi:hypothetical protein
VAQCEVCGNDYDKACVIRAADGSEHTFDSFECAVHQLAPRCEHCGCAKGMARKSTGTCSVARTVHDMRHLETALQRRPLPSRSV